MFTLDDIDAAFQNVTRLKYSQNYHISGKILFQIFTIFSNSFDNWLLHKSFVVYIQLTIGYDI